MNVLFLSPHFPPNFKYFILALRDEGAKVLGVGDAPPNEVPDDVKAALAEYVYEPDMYRRYETLKHAAEGLTKRHGKIDRVDSQNEHWLEHEARLREPYRGQPKGAEVAVKFLRQDLAADEKLAIAHRKALDGRVEAHAVSS